MATYTVTGRGVQTLNANLAGLHVHQVLVGTDATIGNANPANYFHAGLLRLGNAYGWRETRPLDALDMWLDVPAGTTRIGYEVGIDGQISIEEVVLAPTLNSALMPWDRAPQVVVLGTQGSVAAPTASTTVFTYTVPAGRTLALCAAEVEVTRQLAASAIGVNYGWVLVNDQIVVFVAYFSATIGYVDRAEYSGGPLIVPTGNTVKGIWQNADTGGTTYIHLGASGYLFNQ